MKTIQFVAVLLIPLAMVAVAGAKDYALRLAEVPLRDGERIALVEIALVGGRVASVQIPDDWGVEVSAPTSDRVMVLGVAGHGLSMASTSTVFDRFLTVRPSHSEASLSIRVRLGLYFHDPKSGEESERSIDLEPRMIVLEEKAAQPGATDNPDDAQRLREDH